MLKKKIHRERRSKIKQHILHFSGVLAYCIMDKEVYLWWINSNYIKKVFSSRWFGSVD